MVKRILMILLGACIGVGIVAWSSGEIQYEVLLGFITGGIIILIVQFIGNKLKKDKTPDVDERVVTNVRNFLVYCLYGSIMLLFLALVLFTVLDYQTIPLTYLFIYLFLLISVIGIGGQIVKRS